MTGEGVLRTIRYRLFVPGRPTKGKILDAFNREEPNNIAFRLDARKYMDEKYWEAAERDYTPGFYVTVDAELLTVRKVKIDDSASLADRDSKTAQIAVKKEVQE